LQRAPYEALTLLRIYLDMEWSNRDTAPAAYCSCDA
jgi:hypothetical protein